MTLCVQTKASQAKRILEVACGGGLHSLIFAKTILQKGSVLVSCDISESMMKLTKAKYEDVENNYSLISTNKYSITTDLVQPLGEHAFDLEAEITKH